MSAHLEPSPPRGPAYHGERPARQHRPLAVGRLVQIDVEPHRGLAGWIVEVFVSHRTGRDMVKIRTQLDTFVTVERSGVSPLFG